MRGGVRWIKSEAHDVLEAEDWGGKGYEARGGYVYDSDDEDESSLAFWEDAMMIQTYYLIAAIQSWKGA